MTKTVELYFDFGSPTAYLAHKKLQELCKKYNAKVAYEPILLGGIFKATGNSAPGLVPAKGRYMMMHDIPRFVARYQVKFAMNPNFPINTVTLMRGCFVAKELGCFEAYVDCVYDAMWAEPQNLGDNDVLCAVLEKAGLDGKAIVEGTQQPHIKDALKDSTAKAVDRGAFGAPLMFVDNQMFFGQDRLDFVEEILAGK